MTKEQIQRLSVSGASNREIVAVIGREMTSEERQIVDKSRVYGRLQASKRRSLDKPSDASRKRTSRNLDRLKPYRTPSPEAIERRTRLEADSPAWLLYYMPDKFYCPFGQDQLDLIEAIDRAMRTGTSVTAALPRASGKTAILMGSAFKGGMAGVCRFAVVIGWKRDAGMELLDQWLTALAENERIAEDYPCVCDPFQDSTASNRLKGILRNVETEQRAGCDVRKGRGVVLLPDTQEDGRSMPQFALMGASINGSVKGINIGLLSGEVIRPDIVLLDDPQSEEVAESPTLVSKVIKKIDYGIRSLSGPRRRLTMLAAVTCVELDDVSERLLNRPGTESIRRGQIVTWPTGWNDDESKSREAWDEWNRIRIEGLTILKDGGAAARNHYIEHRDELTAGLTVSWEHRFHVGDSERVGDPDALFAAMWDFYDLGELAFMAERQNTPIKQGVTLYNLSIKAILDRTDKMRKAGEIPEWAKAIVCGTDINPSYGLTSVIKAFGENQRNAVLWYGIHKMHVAQDLTDAEKKIAIMAELAIHGRELAALPCVPQHWVIDGGGSPENTVIDFASNSTRTCGIPAMTAFGRASRQYRQSGKKGYKLKMYEQCHVTVRTLLQKWIIFNSDFWREQAQRAWTGTLGAPGSGDLPKGNHREFAEQICREQLAGKVELNGKMIYDWKTAPGPHDFGDADTMCFVGAAVAGIGTGGGSTRPKGLSVRKRYTQAELGGG